MATGAAVVCTDAHGNRDFCVDGENCLVPEANVAAVAEAIGRLLADPALRARLGAAGRRTAQGYAWEPRIDELEEFLNGVAADARNAELVRADARSDAGTSDPDSTPGVGRQTPTVGFRAGDGATRVSSEAV